jgi:LysR family transcriptional regulator for metE and metH
MDLEIRHLQLVRAVAQRGTLTSAGLVLNLTQSALSHQLLDIEARLGTALFLRVGKRLALTPAGERLLASANEVLATIVQTEDAIRRLAGDSRSVLRLTTECYTCYHWLPPLLKRYRHAHPLVDVRIDVSATSAPIAALLEGRLDLAVVSDRVLDRRVVTRPLFDDEMVVVMTPGHPLAAKAFIEARDFAGETLLSYAPKEESTVCQRLLIPAGVSPASLLQVQLTEAIIEMAKAGLGLGVLARWAVEPEVRAGRLQARPLTRQGFKRRWNAATLKELARVPYVSAFTDLLAEHRPFAPSLAQEAAAGQGRARGRRRRATKSGDRATW